MINTLTTKLKNSPLFKDSFWALLGSVLGKGLSLLAGILVARFLGKEMYGQYGLIKNTLINISVFSTLGLGYTGTRYVAKAMSENRDELKHIIRIIYRITLLASSVIAIAVFMFSKQLAILVKAPELNNGLRLTSIIVILNAINTTQIGILSGFKEFKEIAKNNAYSGIVTFLFSGVFSYFWDFNGALIALLISMLYNAIINWRSTSRILQKITSNSCNLPVHTSSKEILSFSIPIALQESMYTIVHLLGSYLMIFYGGYGEMGITSAASQWASVMLFIPGVMKNVMLSYFSSSNSAVSLRKKMVLINFIATFFPWIIITLLSKFISNFYGDTFTNLHIVLSISCLCSVASAVSSVVIYECISCGKNWEMFLFCFLRDLFVLLITWWGLSRIKTIQASIVSPTINTFINLVFMLLLLILAKRIIPKKE